MWPKSFISRKEYLLKGLYQDGISFLINFISVPKVGGSSFSNQDKGAKAHKKIINDVLKNYLWMILHATSTASLIKIKDLHYANNTSFKNHIYRIFVEKRAAPLALAPWATKVVLCKQSCYLVYWRLRRFCQWNKSTESMSNKILFFTVVSNKRVFHDN